MPRITATASALSLACPSGLAARSCDVGTSFSSGNVQDDLYCPAISLLCFVMCIRAGKLAVYLAQELLSHGTLHKRQVDDVRSSGIMAVPAAQGLQHLPSLQAGTAHSSKAAWWPLQ